jgi:hypothetical protein
MSRTLRTRDASRSAGNAGSVQMGRRWGNRASAMYNAVPSRRRVWRVPYCCAEVVGLGWVVYTVSEEDARRRRPCVPHHHRLRGVY